MMFESNLRRNFVIMGKAEMVLLFLVKEDIETG